MHPALGAAFAKTTRALEHLNTVEREIDEFLERNPFRIAVNFQPDSGWHVATFQIIEHPPPRLSVVVGEIAYECLSALNHLTWELACRKVGRRRVMAVKRSVQFPLAESPTHFAKLALVKQGLVSQQAVAVMEGLQPYHGPHGSGRPGNQPATIIKDIADSDKHRVLATAFAELDLSEIVWTWDTTRAVGVTDEDLGTTGPLKDGEKLGRIRFEIGNDEVKVEVDRNPAAEVLFSTNRWLIRRKHLATCCWWVDRIAMPTLAPLFPTPRSLRVVPLGRREAARS